MYISISNLDNNNAIKSTYVILNIKLIRLIEMKETTHLLIRIHTKIRIHLSQQKRDPELKPLL